MDIDGGATREYFKRKALFAEPVADALPDSAMGLAEQLKAACSSVAAVAPGSGLQPPPAKK